MKESVTKTCTKCKEKLSLNCFHKHKRHKDGLHYQCKTCRKQDQQKNKEYISSYKRKYDSENYVKNSEYKRKYRSENKDIINANTANRRAFKLKATPSWLTEDDLIHIKDYYTACQLFKLFTGLTYNVDHIVPLVHPLVCGLHVPWNLQILEEKENMRKGNKLTI